MIPIYCCAVFSKNVLYGANTSPYPAGNYIVTNATGVGFTNYYNGNAGDYALLPTSPYKHVGTDGKDPGADMAVIKIAAMKAVLGK